MKLFFSLLMCCCIAHAFTQDKNAEKFAAIITPEDLKSKLSVIASAQMEGRETATEGQRRAATYIEDYFKKLKLVPGDSGKYQMAFPVLQDSVTGASFTVNNKSFQLLQDFIPYSGIADTSWQLSNIFFRGIILNDSDESVNDSIKGKWIIAFNSNGVQTSKLSLTQTVRFVSSKNAAGLLIITNEFPLKADMLKGRMRLLSGNNNKMPVLFISKAVAESILSLDTSDTPVNIPQKTFNADVQISLHKTTAHLQSTDVIGVLSGTDKKSEYVFVTGHYDHLGKHDSVIYYGADDDGSGTTSVLEIAQAFAAARDKGFTPRRTMVFMTVSGEEKGLWGSKYYTDHPVFPLDSTSVDLNIDMVGRIDPSRNYGDSTNYVYTIGEDKLSSDLMHISDSVNNTYSHLELDRKFNDPNDPNRFYYRSDHYNFASKGVPIIFYFNGTHADYHKPTDTIEKINFDEMAKRAKLVFYTAWAMANRDAMLKRDIPLNQQ